MLFTQRQITEQAKFSYSLLGKAFEKQTKMIENQGEKQIKVLENRVEKIAFRHRSNQLLLCFQKIL